MLKQVLCIGIVLSDLFFIAVGPFFKALQAPCLEALEFYQFQCDTDAGTRRKSRRRVKFLSLSSLIPTPHLFLPQQIQRKQVADWEKKNSVTYLIL